MLGGDRSVLRRRDFVAYWTATTVSGLGSGASLVALPLLAVEQLGASGDEVGVLWAGQAVITSRCR